jgi:dCMP deaminase
MRTDKTNWFLDLAERCARQGTCLRRNFGAVIVDANNTIVSTGYTGAPVEQVDCLQKGTCWREQNNIPSGKSYEKCCSVHAEMNALLQAGKNARGGILYLAGIDVKTGETCSIYPCFLCIKMILNAGISRVVVRKNGESSVEYAPQEIYDRRYVEAFNDKISM